MQSQTSNPQSAAPVEIIASREFVSWLKSAHISIAFSTYQTSRLMLLGVNSRGEIAGCERVFDRAMGLYVGDEQIYLSCRYQIWQLDNVLSEGQLYEDCDKLYIPRIGYTTGDLDVHDLIVEEPDKRLVFVSSTLNCLATTSNRHSCLPLWQPSFISKLINEDRCHLNGLAMVDGKARYVTACSQSDVVDGWRDRRDTGGCVIDVQSNEVIATGLSMPHSPRWHQGKLWVLNSGTGYLGYIDQGKFEQVTFCPGFLRGLSFVGNYAVVGTSKPRGGDKTFSGLALDEHLRAKDAEARCGLLVIDLNTGTVVYWVRLEGQVTELYDVQILPRVKRPHVLGFHNDDISKIITIDPRSPLVDSNQPVAASMPSTALPRQQVSGGQQSLAERLYQQVLELKQQGKVSEALGICQQLINQYPQYAPAWHQLGLILDNLGQREPAIEAYKQALKINPDYVEVHNNLGIMAVAQDDLKTAIACFQSAITANPNYAFAHNNLGLVLQMQGQLDLARVKFKEALQKNPDYADAHVNLGVALEDGENPNIPEAIAHYQLAINLNPHHIKAYNRLALALIKQEEVEAGIALLEKALTIQPNAADSLARLFAVKESVCDWRNREADLSTLWQLTEKQLNLGQETSVTPFDTLYKPWSSIQQLRVARRYAQLVERQLSFVSRPLNFSHPRTHSGRLKIGYLCHDFRYHPTSHLLRSVFGLHDRQHFEIVAYSYGPNDESDYRRSIEADCDHFHDIASLSVTQSAQKIFADGIQILVDLMAYLDKARPQILALRPAPIQVNYLVYPGTMGAEFMDYLIGDGIVTPPESATAFTEKLVIMPHSYQANDYRQAIATTPITRAQYGLPESGFVFCCFNHTYKIEPRIFEVWMNILKAVPESVLWLFSRAPVVERNLRREAAARGVAGERLVFAHFEKKPEHLARHQLADLFLDTLYYNAHTTASDALWAGLPIITLPGETFPSRVGASLLTAIGLPELIVGSLGEYMELAIHLANTPEELRALKQKLAQNRTTYPLFDTPLFTRNLERAYSAMWEIYRTGKSPQLIDLR